MSFYVVYIWETQELFVQNNLTNQSHTSPWSLSETCCLLMNTCKLGELQAKKCTQILRRCEIFNTKSEAYSKNWFKIWGIGSFLNENLTRWNFFDSNSGALYFFEPKIWRAVFALIDNLTHTKNFNSKSCFWMRKQNANHVVFKD